MASVVDIVTDRILKKSEEERLPWLRDFVTYSHNWATKRKYSGLNSLLLTKGEYISFNQLMQTLEKYNIDLCKCLGVPTTVGVPKGASREELANFKAFCDLWHFKAPKGTYSKASVVDKARVALMYMSPAKNSSDLAVFWNRKATDLSEAEYAEAKSKSVSGLYTDVKNGVTGYHRVKYTLLYHLVFPIDAISGQLSITSALRVLKMLCETGYCASGAYANMSVETFTRHLTSALDTLASVHKVGYTLSGDTISFVLLSKAVVYSNETLKQGVLSPDEIIEPYVSSQGIRVTHNDVTGCYYSETSDRINILPKGRFLGLSGYYRTFFHEMTHSTGTVNRLNRKCFVNYRTKTERSKEEVIAELGSLFLASYCKLDESIIGGGTKSQSSMAEGLEIDFDKNSDNYILSWGKWIKDNKQEFLSAVSAAKSAVEWILEQAGFESADGYFEDADEEDTLKDNEEVVTVSTVKGTSGEEVTGVKAMSIPDKQLTERLYNLCMKEKSLLQDVVMCYCKRENVNCYPISEWQDGDYAFSFGFKLVNTSAKMLFIIFTISVGMQGNAVLGASYGVSPESDFKVLGTASSILPALERLVRRFAKASMR